MLTIELAGETLQLHHQRAIYWDASKMLIVADTHFGKDGIFRQHGIPIPAGSVANDLERLSALIEETAAQRLLVLGDFIHAAMDKTQPFIQEFRQWRHRYQALQIDVVLGNHDRRLDPTLYDGIDWHEDLREGEFLFVHEPTQCDAAYVLCGHIHPVLRLTAGKGDAMRMPVFWFQEGVGTLPAFGSMTGGFNIKPATQDRLYLIGPDAVVPMQA